MIAEMYNRDSCRLCGSREIELALPIQASPIGDAYVTHHELDKTQPSYPLDLYLCHPCGHLQLNCVINPDILFKDYIYRTATSPGLVAHFKTYAEEVLAHLEGNHKGFVVEIGSNDGSLLNFFKQNGMRVLGIDPAQTIAAEASSKGIETLAQFFTHDLARQIREQYGPAQLICANNVFAHVDSMNDLLAGIAHLLAPDGIFVFEASYLVDILDKKLFDTIYHEHLCYHRIQPLERFFNRYNMCLFDVKRINTKGGSIRGFAKLISSERTIEPRVQQLIDLEKQMALQDIRTYHQFADHLLQTKSELIQLLSQLKTKGKKIIGYGASPTVTTTLYHFELNSYLDYIVDDNPIKQGRYSPGAHLPVLSPEIIYEEKPDYIVVLAWQYAKMIMQKHPRFMEEGGHFIIPLPFVDIK